MAQLAKVVAVIGNAFVVGRDGVPRVLKVGDVIQQGETIRTAAGGHVELMMADGQVVGVAPEHTVRVDDSMLHDMDATAQGNASAITPQDASVQSATIEKVIQAIQNGGDLNPQLEAAAAGSGAGGDGGGDSTFVRLLRVSEGVNPLAYDYAPPTLPTVNEVIPPGGVLTTTNDIPAISVQNDNPQASTPGGLTSESALPACTGGGSTVSSGVFNITTGHESVGALVVGGVDVTHGGVVVGEHGTLVVTVVDGQYHWSYTLTGPLQHPPGQDVINGDSFTVTVTDSTGDKVSTDFAIQVRDDSPHVTLTAVDSTEVNLITNDTAAVTPGHSTASANFSADFTTHPVFGADGPGNLSIGNYSLSLVKGDGEDSGLTSHGQVITLSKDAATGDIVGSTGAGEIFRIHVDSNSGTITLTQEAAMDQPVQGPDTVSLASGLVSLSASATITDSDGDIVTASASLDLGGKLGFQDAVPVVVADNNGVTEGATVSADALHGVLANDLSGADGWAAGGGVVGVVQGSNTAVNTVDSTTVNHTINGLYGTLTLNSDGSYSYHANANAITADQVDTFVYTVRDGDGDLKSTTLSINLANVTVSTQGGMALVNEAGLPVIGSHAGDGSNVATGSVTAGGGVGAYSYTLSGNGVGSYGTLVLNSDGSYTYTLTKPFTETPANNGTDTVSNTGENFTYTATDANGNSVTGTIHVNIVDDVPVVVADSNSVTEGATVSADALHGVLANDLSGADGWAAGGGVVGVVQGSNTAVNTVDSATVNHTINGLYGTLTLNSDGSYSYHATANAISADSVDTFVYTVRDGDGDLKSTTLSINVANLGVTSTGGDTTANEAGLPVIGSHAGDGSNVAQGVLVSTGGAGGYTYTLSGTGAGSYGTLALNSDGSYTYTLTKPFTEAQANNGTDTVSNTGENFTYTVTDSLGNTSNGVIHVNIVDDVPVVVADSNSVTEGATVGGNVISNDLSGADGWAAGGGVVGVVQGSNTAVNTVDSTTVNHTINGLYGTLTLNSDGSYSYHANANAITANQIDTFVYTVRDGDGDLKSTTLSINLANVTVSTQGGTALVNEAGLPVIGSHAGDGSNVATGSVTAGGGVGAYSYTLSGTGVGSYGTLVLNSDGSYTYTLTKPFTETPANNGTDTVSNTGENFTYTATDANGNSVTGTIHVNIVDDVPVVVADSNNVTEGATVGGNVISNDLSGADGWAVGGAVVGVVAGTTVADHVNANVGTTINGLYGTLTLNSDGSYSYHANANAITANQIDTFVYTVRDGDGDLKSTTLSINLANVTVSTQGGTALVNEAGLSVIGSHAGDGSNVATGSVTAGGGVGAYSYTLSGNGVGSYGTLVLNSDGSYTYTLTKPFTEAPANNGTDTVSNTGENFTYTATDANGNSVTGTIHVNIVDDVPVLNSVSNSELWDYGTNSVNGSYNLVAGADGLAGLQFTGFTDGAAGTLHDGSAMTSGGATVYFYGAGTGHMWGQLSDGTHIFDIVMSNDGTYSVTMAGVIDSLSQFNLQNIGNLGVSGGNGSQYIIGAGTTGTSADDILITTVQSGGSVNTSQGAIGANNNWVDTKEGLRFDFVNNVQSNGSYTDHRELTGVSIGLGGLQGGVASADVLIGLIEGATTTANGTQVLTAANWEQTVTSITYVSGGVTHTLTGFAQIDAAYQAHQIDFVSNYNANGTLVSGVVVHGVDAYTSVGLTTNTTFDAVDFVDYGSSSFRVGAVSGAYVTHNPVTFDGQVYAVDGDGDHSATQTFSVTADPVLVGTTGNDVLIGGAYNDLIIGGKGNDTMTGGLGADVFKWNLNDQGVPGTPAVDHITDFTPAQHDALDMKDLLVGEHGTAGVTYNLDSFLNFTVESGHVVLNVAHAGGGVTSGTIDQKIVFDNYTSLQTLATALGAASASSHDIILKMIATGALKTDA